MIHAVIMAGGKGERFWPLSREKTPKQFLPILGNQTMLEETISRLNPRIPRERTWIITSEFHAKVLKKQLKDIPSDQIIAEPVGRNTAPCVILAANAIANKDPQGVMVVLPADHAISPKREFQRTISACAQAAQKNKALITIGIKPRGPATGYGYILRRTQPLFSNSQNFWPVERFTEKPDLKQARRFIRNPRYSWNSGMFIWTVKQLLEEADLHLPEVAKKLAPYRELPRIKQGAFLKKIYPQLPSISIDYGIMEKAQNVLVTTAGFKWDDVGAWDALSDHIKLDRSGNHARGNTVTEDSSNCIVFSSGPLIGTVGVKDLVVVATPDAVLVCPRGKTQEVKKLVNQLQKKGKLSYL